MQAKKEIKRKELLHIVNKLHMLFFTSSSENREDLRLAVRIVECCLRWHSREGLHGLKRFKTMSNYFIRHLMGVPLESIPLSNRFMRLINKALERCGNTQSQVYWVSIFSAHRLFQVAAVVDVSTITSRFKGSLWMLFSLNYLKASIRVNKSFSPAIKAGENWSTSFKWYISGSGGPNGPSAYTRYLDDLRSLNRSWLLIGLFTLFIALPYVNKWETVMILKDTFIESLSKGGEHSIHSRLAFLSDKGGKTRVVAIGDILSQSVLNTVHQRCNAFLRKLKQDGTFDQDRSRRYIKKMSGDSVPLASIDLTAATDRMPVLLQVYVIVSLRILTPLQAFGWWWVVTRRDFIYKDGYSLKRIRYKVGQPMGLLSSWPVMAISHHYLVRLAFAAQGRKNLDTAPYCVLGDDLTLHGHGVAEEYLKLISFFGMDYSPEKTYIAMGVAEFAKSLFCHGRDLTPFPLALLRFNKNTIVSNTLAVVAECKRINLSLTAQTLVRINPRRWRNLVLLAALSPSSPRYGLDLHSRLDHWTFLLFMFKQRIRYFARLNNARNSIHVFVWMDPGKSDRLVGSPYRQIAADNSESYPVREFFDEEGPLNHEILLGSSWISYCSKAWPNGLPSLEDKKLIPGPAWRRDLDDVIFRSSLLMLNKLLPNYFTVRCVGKNVEE